MLCEKWPVSLYQDLGKGPLAVQLFMQDLSFKANYSHVLRVMKVLTAPLIMMIQSNGAKPIKVSDIACTMYARLEAMYMMSKFIGFILHVHVSKKVDYLLYRVQFIVTGRCKKTFEILIMNKFLHTIMIDLVIVII